MSAARQIFGEDLLQGRSIALSGATARPIRELLQSLGARIIDLDPGAAGDGQCVSAWAESAGQLDALVCGPGSAGQAACAEIRHTLDALGHAWAAVSAAANASFIPARGGRIVLLAPRPGELAHAEAVCAALEAASPTTRLAARVLSALTPRLGVIGVDSALISRDPEVVRAYDADPLVSHGKLPARTVFELERAVRSLPASVHAITVPTLIMYGSADRLCPPAGSLGLHDCIGAQDRTLKVYDGLYHEIFNEPEQESVLEDVCAWLRERM